MDAKLALVVIFALFALLDLARAEFLYNRKLPKEHELESLGLKCISGRTVIKMREKPIELDSEDEDSDEETRRSHMRLTTDDESCQVCVCSVDAKNEYCSNRPASNVNECMSMAVVMSDFKKNEPFDHQRTLSNMIRRGWSDAVSASDLIWHDDEIPHPPHSRCKRSRSYYSNNANANDTDIEVASDVESLLDYGNPDVCFYCVCSTAGDAIGCIPRNPWYCQFFRGIRNPNAARHRYKLMFHQDRPAYFRHISWRLRRTMDNGMFDMIENGGDSLCCGHSDGHRRQLHHQVRNKIRLLKNKVNKENLLAKGPGGDYVDFVVNND